VTDSSATDPQRIRTPEIRHLVVRDVAQYLQSRCGMSEPEAWTHAGAMIDQVERDWDALVGGDA
jgi:hypothetical protein